MVTAANCFKQTKAFDTLSPQEQQAIWDAGHDRHHEAVKEGLFSIHDAMVAMAQNPQRVCWYTQPVHHGRFIDKPEVRFCDQRDLEGRLKMYGKEEHFDFSRKRQ
jgi:hypothetical protein